MVRVTPKVLPMQNPLLRGMVSYAVIWPSASIVQGYLQHETWQVDWARAARFGIFGAFIVVPMLHGWMSCTNRFFTKKDLATSLKRAAVEQLTVGPVFTANFFFTMSLLELKTVEAAVKEVKDKFWPTYKVGMFFWPTVQTINFYFISEKNRLMFLSLASFVFTVFMAHIKTRKKVKEL